MPFRTLSVPALVLFLLCFNEICNLYRLDGRSRFFLLTLFSFYQIFLSNLSTLEFLISVGLPLIIARIFSNYYSISLLNLIWDQVITQRGLAIDNAMVTHWTGVGVCDSGLLDYWTCTIIPRPQYIGRPHQGFTWDFHLPGGHHHRHHHHHHRHNNRHHRHHDSQSSSSPTPS